MNQILDGIEGVIDKDLDKQEADLKAQLGVGRVPGGWPRLDWCRRSTESTVSRGGQRPSYDEYTRPNLVEPHQVRCAPEQRTTQFRLTAVLMQVAHVAAGQ